MSRRTPKPIDGPLRVPAFDTLPISTACTLHLVGESKAFAHSMASLARALTRWPSAKTRPARFVLRSDTLELSEWDGPHAVKVTIPLTKAENLSGNRQLPVAGLADLTKLLRLVQIARRRGQYSECWRITYEATDEEGGSLLVEVNRTKQHFGVTWSEWQKTMVDHVPVPQAGAGRAVQDAPYHLKKGLDLAYRVAQRTDAPEQKPASRKKGEKEERAPIRIVRVADGAVMGQGANTLALYSHPSLDGIFLEVTPGRSQQCLARVLGHIAPAVTLFDAGDFQVLTDGVTWLAWHRSLDLPPSGRTAVLRDASASSGAHIRKEILSKKLPLLLIVRDAIRSYGVRSSKIVVPQWSDAIDWEDVRHDGHRVQLRLRWDDNNCTLDGRLCSESGLIRGEVKELATGFQSSPGMDGERIEGLVNLAAFARALDGLSGNYVTLSKMKLPGISATLLTLDADLTESGARGRFMLRLDLPPARASPGVGDA